MARVLLIDDDPWVREAVVAQLAEIGHDVQEAATFEEVRAVVPSAPQPPDFVLLDARIPGAEPAEVLAVLRAAWPATPVLLHSGYDRDWLPAELFAVPRVGFVGKPLDMGELERELARLE